MSEDNPPRQLRQFFADNPRVGLGFSGGVDSSYLLWAGLSVGAEVVPYFVNSVFQPKSELADARRLSEGLGVELRILEVDILAHEQVRTNPASRCYACKVQVFRLICRQAAADGLTAVVDGSNASDDPAERPGMAALTEHQVRSPLREAKLSKTQVRRLSSRAGLFTAGKPAYACLATRIPTGRAITVDLLERVEAAEQVLTELGFTDFRVRVLGEDARLQLLADQFGRAADQHGELCARLGEHFSGVLLDLKPR